MRINYDADDDILCIRFSDAPVVKEVSHGWNVHVSYDARGIAEIVVLEAKEKGYWPIENAQDLLRVTA